MKKECDCRASVIGGRIIHEGLCASWENTPCQFCGSETESELHAVIDRGKQLMVCAGCRKNQFKT